MRLARAAEETKTSEEMKSTLLATLAHDLKTPVAAARGAIENWAAEAGSSERSRLALSELESLTRRIGQLMDVVRLDSGVARPRREVVNCAEIVEAAVARFGDAIAEHALLSSWFSNRDSGRGDRQLTEALGHGIERGPVFSAGAEIRVSASEDGLPPSSAFRTRNGDSDSAGEGARTIRSPPSAAGVPGTGLVSPSRAAWLR
jgi:signal transduction histidine kinase